MLKDIYSKNKRCQINYWFFRGGWGGLGMVGLSMDAFIDAQADVLLASHFSVQIPTHVGELTSQNQNKSRQTIRTNSYRIQDLQVLLARKNIRKIKYADHKHWPKALSMQNKNFGLQTFQTSEVSQTTHSSPQTKKLRT